MDSAGARFFYSYKKRRNTGDTAMTGTTHMRLPIFVGGDVCAFCAQKQQRRRAWLPDAFKSYRQGQNSRAGDDASKSKSSAAPERNVLTSCNRPRPQTTCDVRQSTRKNHCSWRNPPVFPCYELLVDGDSVRKDAAPARLGPLAEIKNGGVLSVATETSWKRHCSRMPVLDAVTE